MIIATTTIMTTTHRLLSVKTSLTNIAAALLDDRLTHLRLVEDDVSAGPETVWSRT